MRPRQISCRISVKVGSRGCYAALKVTSQYWGFFLLNSRKYTYLEVYYGWVPWLYFLLRPFRSKPKTVMISCGTTWPRTCPLEPLERPSWWVTAEDRKMPRRFVFVFDASSTDFYGTLSTFQSLNLSSKTGSWKKRWNDFASLFVIDVLSLVRICYVCTRKWIHIRKRIS